jgi:hypothetical protein
VYKPSFTRYRFQYTDDFEKDLKRYASLRKQITRKVNAILENPFHNTELLKKTIVQNVPRKRLTMWSYSFILSPMRKLTVSCN